MRTAVVSDFAQSVVCWLGVVVTVAVRSELSGRSDFLLIPGISAPSAYPFSSPCMRTAVVSAFAQSFVSTHLIMLTI